MLSNFIQLDVMLCLRFSKCGHIWLFVHVYILITQSSSNIICGGELSKNIFVFAQFFVFVSFLFTNKSPLIFFFVTMNKCFHVPFKNIKNWILKNVGLNVCIVGHPKD